MLVQQETDERKWKYEEGSKSFLNVIIHLSRANFAQFDYKSLSNWSVLETDIKCVGGREKR